MKKYFVHDGKDQQGPFDIAELQGQKINRETLIWFEGITNWTKAGEVSALTNIFQAIPPPINVQSPPTLIHQQEKKAQPSAIIAPLPKQKSHVGLQIFAIVSIVISTICILWGLLISIAAAQDHSAASESVSALGAILAIANIFYLIFCIVVLVSLKRIN